MNRPPFATGLLAAGLIAAGLLSAAGATRAAEVAGVKIDDSVQVGGATLILNGAGKRTKVFFDVYVAGLYLPAKRAAARDVLDAPGPGRVSMSMMRDLGPDKLIEALQEGIRQNATAAELDAIHGQLDVLVADIQSIGAVRRGDVITIDFLPDGSTRLAVNGAARGRPIAGAAFQRALLAVWLGDKPVQADLKTALLGG